MEQDVKLAGKVAVVTGASRGIGKAVAIALAREGADIVIASRTDAPKPNAPGTNAETAEAVRAFGRQALPVRTDLSRQADIDGLVKQTLDAFGRVDVLVNNAAFTGRPLFLPLWEMTREQWEVQFAVNVHAPFMLIKGFAPSMREHGGGVVVNVTSGSAHHVSLESGDQWSQGAGYGTTKAALNRMSNAVARELLPHNIAVIAMEPGYVLTELMEVAVKTRGIDATTAILTSVPANAVVYLAACPNPMAHAGQVVSAPDLAREHGLV